MTIYAALVAPAELAPSSTSSMLLSESAGMIGATITPQGTPAEARARSVSRRRCGLAARGSNRRANARSSVPMET